MIEVMIKDILMYVQIKTDVKFITDFPRRQN